MIKYILFASEYHGYLIRSVKINNFIKAQVFIQVATSSLEHIDLVHSAYPESKEKVDRQGSSGD